MLCPNCGADNIEGVDLCERCGTDLAGLDLPAERQGWKGRLLTARLGDLPLSEAIVVAPSDRVDEAVVRMREAGAGCVLVMEDGALVGLFNERHLLARVLREGLDPRSTAVGDVMSRDPLQLSPEDPPAYAIHCMVARSFRHLAVVSDRGVVGYLSVRHVLAFLDDEILADTSA